MLDYIIVGSGLAGIAFAETALKNGKSIYVFDNNSQNSSRIAGGLYNPVILKRFSGLQNAQEQLDALQVFYNHLEIKLGVKLNFNLPVLRKFFSIEEQNNWFAASDKISLSPFLSTTILTKQFRGMDAPFGYGEVLQTGYVDTALLLNAYRDFLIQNDSFECDDFDYNNLNFTDSAIIYKDKTAKDIIFAEGFGVHANPFFNQLPLDGTKGELFIIKAPDLVLDVILNTNVFILPLGNHLYKVGATYNWDDKTSATTEAGKQELIEKIKEILNCEFEIIEHLAGIRPTVKDRKPLLGTHPIYKNLHIFNGLGTRGVMLGPYMANILFDCIENGTAINAAYNITRFDKRI